MTTPGRSTLFDPTSPWRACGALFDVTAFVVAVSGAGLGVENSLHSLRDQLHVRAATGQVALVEMDARSLSAFQRWPWPRSLYGRVVTALSRAGASAIAFDVDFSARSDPKEDQAFGEAIAASAAPVMLPTFQQSGSRDGGGTVENIPIPELRGRAMLASVNILPDEDGFVRAAPVGSVTEGLTRPAIAAILANSAGRYTQRVALDGSIDPATIPRVSFVDLVNNPSLARQFKGKSVVIGATAIEMGDHFLLPNHGQTPGVLIHILAAETLLQRSSPTSFGPWILSLLALAGALVALRLKGGWRTAALAALSAVVFATPLALECLKLGTVEIAPALAGLAVAAVAAQIHAAVQALSRARMVDADTELPNARALNLSLSAASSGAVVALRIANYGEVHGVMGRDSAAELIRRVAERLQLASLTPVHRVGENALAWIDPTPDEEAWEDRVHAVAAVLRAPIQLDGRPINLAFGFGLAALAGTPKAALGRALLSADSALSRNDRFEKHTEDLERAADWRMELAAELDQALSNGDIWVAYQPKLDLVGGGITSSEALVRWRHPRRGPISPDAFIPGLEAMGRMSDLTLFVLRRAMEDQAAWRAQGLSISVSVNVSAQLPKDPEFVAAVEALVGEYRPPEGMITLEVTESAAMQDPEAAIAALTRFAQMGLVISVDDYGAGQSTLGYLKALPAKELKIDQGFVVGMAASRSDQAMVRSTIELAHELGYKVVAEGVETLEILELLAGFGCDYAQGWHVGRPVTAERFFEMASGDASQAA